MNLRTIWIYTQTTMAAADLFSLAPTGRYLLHSVVGQMTALYDKFSKAHAAVLDVPQPQRHVTNTVCPTL